MATLRDIFVANVRKLLAQRGWSYAQLSEQCNGELSKAYVSAFKYAEKVNPSLDVVEIVAKAFKISPQALLDPTLDYNHASQVPEGYLRKTYTVNDFQDFTISKWESVNLAKIKHEQLQAFNNIERLKN